MLLWLAVLERKNYEMHCWSIFRDLHEGWHGAKVACEGRVMNNECWNWLICHLQRESQSIAMDTKQLHMWHHGRTFLLHPITTGVIDTANLFSMDLHDCCEANKLLLLTITWHADNLKMSNITLRWWMVKVNSSNQVFLKGTSTDY